MQDDSRARLLPGEELEDLRGELEPVPGDRIKLSWDSRPLWGKTTPGTKYKWGNEAVLFRVYWDAGTGAPMALLEETSRQYIVTEPLASGTYVFRIDPVDAAGNQLTSSIETTYVHVAFPQPPSEFFVTSYDAGTTTFEAEWVESPSEDVTAYHVYSNHGDGPIDYLTPVATIAAPATSGSWVEVATAGQWRHTIRAASATYTEDNITEIHAYEIGGDPLEVLGLQPATPINFIAIPRVGGTFVFAMQYPAGLEVTMGIAVRIYHDAGTGTIDYDTPLLVEDIPTHVRSASVVLGIGATSGALTHGTRYTFAARAVDADGRESASTDEVTARADARPPGEVMEIAAEDVLGLPFVDGYFGG